MKTTQDYQRSNRWLFFSMFIVAFGFVIGACVSGNAQSGTPVSDLETTGQQGESYLTAELSAPETVPLCGPVEVEFTITNEGEKALYLLSWYTPLEGVLGDIFRVTYQGRELGYQGPMVMRAAPLPDQYVFLEPGASQTAVVDLSQAYDFSEAGEYTIAYRSPSISHVARVETEFAESVDELGPVEILSSPITVDIVPSEGDGECSQGVESPPTTWEDQGEEVLDLKGVVMDVSLSAEVISLKDEVGGISSVALLNETKIVSDDGSDNSLGEIESGMSIWAVGRPGEEGALLADRVVVLD